MNGCVAYFNPKFRAAPGPFPMFCNTTTGYPNDSATAAEPSAEPSSTTIIWVGGVLCASTFCKVTLKSSALLKTGIITVTGAIFPSPTTCLSQSTYPSSLLALWRLFACRSLALLCSNPTLASIRPCNHWPSPSLPQPQMLSGPSFGF